MNHASSPARLHLDLPDESSDEFVEISLESPPPSPPRRFYTSSSWVPPPGLKKIPPMPSTPPRPVQARPPQRISPPSPEVVSCWGRLRKKNRKKN